MEEGAQRFLNHMTEFGLFPMVEAAIVLYRVMPVDGAHAGCQIETGVGLDELTMWPQVPPHWIHFPASIRFWRTNSQPSPKSGWLMHSRQIRGWGDAHPTICWVSHLRAVLSEATA